MDGVPQTAAEEWRRYWPLVLAAMLGMSFYSLFAYSNQMFIQPLEAEFHWARRDIAFGYSIYAFMAFLFGPLIGTALDRLGARKIGLPGLFLSSLAFASLSFTGSQIWTWFALWFVLATVGLAVKSTVWTVAVSNAFTHGRAMALSVMLSGSALAQFGGPFFGSWLIHNFGWRQTYIAFGLGWGGLALLVGLFLLRDSPRAKPAATGGTAPILPGLPFRKAIFSRAMILIFIVNLFNSLFGSGVTFQLKPILSETVLGEGSAAMVAAMAGFAGIVGKLGTGWLLDRTESRWVPALSFGIGAIAYYLLLDTFNSRAAMITGVLIYGMFTGAGLSVTAFLVSRHVGLKSFGAVYGVLGSMLMLGSALGPPLAGAVYDHFHSYHPLLWAVIPVCLIDATLMLFLGSYPVFAAGDAEPA